MTDLILWLIVGAIFWPAVIYWARHLEGCGCMDELRADPHDVADLERELPDVRDLWRRRR